MVYPERTVANFSPGTGFPAVSVTGTECELMCAHCMGKHLCGMIPAGGPERLLEIAEEVIAAGGEGMLISGGSRYDGKVPLAHFYSAMREIADRGLLINVHPGIIGREDAELLVSSGASRFSVDLHRDPETIRRVFNLPGPEVYEGTLDSVMRAGGKPVPHLTVGFGDADLIGSAELAISRGLEDVVLLALVSTEGTPFEDHKVSEKDVTDAVETLMEMDLSVTLGCMRDRRMRDLERKCVDLGVRKIANMSRGTEERLLSEGFDIVRFDRCCCFGSEQYIGRF